MSVSDFGLVCFIFPFFHALPALTPKRTLYCHCISLATYKVLQLADWQAAERRCPDRATRTPRMTALVRLGPGLIGCPDGARHRSQVICSFAFASFSCKMRVLAPLSPPFLLFYADYLHTRTVVRGLRNILACAGWLHSAASTQGIGFFLARIGHCERRRKKAGVVCWEKVVGTKQVAHQCRARWLQKTKVFSSSVQQRCRHCPLFYFVKCNG